MPTKPKVLVLGATGFLGAHVARAFAARGYPVRAARRETSATWHLEDVDVEWAHVDLDGPDSAQQLDAALDGCRGVVDCAGYYAHDALDVDGARRRGVGRLRNVMEAVKRNRVARHVFISSPATLGTGGPDDDARTPLDEDHFYTPGTVDDAYFESKWSMEAEIYRYLLQDVPSVVLIPGAVFGPGDIKPTTGEFLTRLARGQLPAYVGDTFNAVDVRDVANTTVNAVERGRPGRRYVLGGHNLSVQNFVRRAADIADVDPPTRKLPGAALRRVARAAEFVGRRTGLLDDPLLVGLDMVLYARPLASERAEGELDHQARSLEATLEDSFAWFRNNGYL